MCEPYHSIVQYPDQTDGGTPTDALLQRSLKDRVLDWMKRVVNWLHFSKLGSGHSEALRHLGRHTYLIPEETRYEACWWNRTVHLDGTFHGPDYDKGLALEAATTYARYVSIGSLGTLRRFLETSLRKTDRPYLYVQTILDSLLTREGREQAYQKLKRCLHSKFDIIRQFGHNCGSEAVETAIKVLLGFTRKRNMLASAWADDDSLWTPGQLRDERVLSPRLAI